MAKSLSQAMAEKGYICGHFPALGKDFYVKASTIAFIPPYNAKDKLVTVVTQAGQEVQVLVSDLSKQLGADVEAE